ncbi:hypothetical protein F5Y18DRAFT_432997 [Xylariaceae sp. FL1019]|nr:hypothetical protein F5Y18DRAFT_432997 [Xylariaceae sp. FL1019]
MQALSDNMQALSIFGSAPSHTRQIFRLLDLPRELLFVLAENMPAATANVLSRTCRALYQFFKDNFHVTEAPLKRWQAVSAQALARPGRWVCDTEEEYLAWISAIARDRPDDWVCEVCMCLHKIKEDDLLRSDGLPSRLGKGCGDVHCHKDWALVTYSGPRRTYSPTRLGRELRHTTFQFPHRHIQAALKAVRLRNFAYEDYVKALTKSSRVELASTPRSEFQDQCCVFPRIVRDGGELHLMLHTVWHISELNYKARDRPEFGTHRKNIELCPHLRISGSPPCVFQEVQQIEESSGDEMIVYHRLRDNVIRTDSQHINCKNCPTDVHITGSEDFSNQGWAIFVDAWQDLGKEESPLNDIWRSQCLGTARLMRIDPHMDVVRSLYELPDASSTHSSSQQSVLESHFKPWRPTPFQSLTESLA